ncbi:DUF3617 domain-containing protein [Brevundimonas sp. TWP2-3-4b1]|uniref:DUF3617 domain-containing protein n=1 Tax=Brevundimonas sp. TWP2-3-4b1 TaxID=2804580 RepID=UPI003CED91D7
MTLPSLLRRTVAVAAPAIAGAVLLAAPSSPSQAQGAVSEVLPGYWEYTTSAVGIRSTETKCVRPSEINRFFGGLSTRRWQCVYPTRVVGGGTARFEGTCTDPRGRRVNVRLGGSYQQENFRFTGGAQLARGTPYLPASITARRLAAVCPADAEYF